MASEDKVHEVETMLMPLFRRDLSPSTRMILAQSGCNSKRQYSRHLFYQTWVPVPQYSRSLHASPLPSLLRRGVVEPCRKGMCNLKLVLRRKNRVWTKKPAVSDRDGRTVRSKGLAAYSFLTVLVRRRRESGAK